MIGRIVAMSVALSFLGVFAAVADEPVGEEEFQVPTRQPVVIERETVVMEESVTAPPPPYIAVESRSIAAGIGFSWGQGVLTFEGRDYAFSVKGLSLVDLGASKDIAIGDVRNLESLSDFEGQYLAIEAGAAAGIGRSAQAMRNEKGVVITLRSTRQGAQLTLGPEGLSVELK